MSNEQHFHLHLISDSTGETLIAASRAVTAQYKNAHPIEHIYPMARNKKKLDEILSEIDAKPGIVLYTIADQELGDYITENCKRMGLPIVSILQPVFSIFQKYLGIESERKVGAQHELNPEYFKRIEALNYTLLHDDGQLPDDLENAEVLLLGISRTSKTPTSIYLANRGIKTINLPLVPSLPLPEKIFELKKPLVVALIASTDRIYQVRQNRLLGIENEPSNSDYIDRATIAAELAYTRKLCKKHSWPMIDVTRKSIEETAAEIITLHNLKKDKTQN